MTFRRRANFGSRMFAPARLPLIADNNSTFNDDGDATTGWTAAGGTVASASSVVRHTKTTAPGSGASSIKKSVTFVPSNRDWILYGKVRVSAGTNHIGVLWFLNGSSEAALWFGSSAGNTSYTDDAVALVGHNGSRQVASAGSFDYTNNWFEFALQFDIKFTQLVLWQRLGDGSWDFKARVPCSYFAPSPSEVQLLMTTNTPSSGWIEFDYLTLCRPNIVAIGDSICAGATLYNPNRTVGLSNDDSMWMKTAVLYPSLRNNLIVNKGVGSQGSLDIANRMADATDQTPRVVFLHASSNDEGLGVSKSSRTTNIQNSINSVTAAGGQCVLLNAMYGTDAGADNTPTNDLRDYMLDWWDNFRPTLATPPALSIDIMQPILLSGFMNPAYTQADGIHPTVSGYGLQGTYILGFN